MKIHAARRVSMAESDLGTGTPHYDRDFLLSPGKRNQVMALWEVEKFGTDSFGDPDYVSIYGMRPAEWYARCSAVSTNDARGGA
jgi:hypothetical protein